MRLLELDYKKIEKLKRFEFFPNIFGRVLLNGDRMTFFIVEVPPESKIRMHNHENEQMGICLKGKAEFVTENKKEIISEGMVYRFAPYEKHAINSIINESSLFLDVFSPARTDYIRKQKMLEKNSTY
jgi:quercetin dioxygenase-like cupin family protein